MSTEGIPRALWGWRQREERHNWARVIGSFGHEVRLIAPQFVKPYLKGQKNDSSDAAAICEAVSRPEMRFVAPKSMEQQDLQALKPNTTRQSDPRATGGIWNHSAAAVKSAPNRAADLGLRRASASEFMFARQLFAGLYEELCTVHQRIHSLEPYFRARRCVKRLLRWKEWGR